ncbi:MAG: AbrB/MazE/SpoVT family DNA-binding domain-containing protein [Clostridia bacterium]|nr:AbrB/MazE/SpoVT family DNA-binding domain-containing protein [Clostridia bacterium]
MKSIGMVRRVDELGRVVVPMELRRTMGIDNKDPLEIFVKGDKIILQKNYPRCVFCGESQNAVQYKGKLICHDCIEEMLKL